MVHPSSVERLIVLSRIPIIQISNDAGARALTLRIERGKQSRIERAFEIRAAGDRLRTMCGEYPALGAQNRHLGQRVTVECRERDQMCVRRLAVDALVALFRNSPFRTIRR